MKKINVLSLFDGMSCGRIALDRAGIEVEQYYASELDKYAITVTQANWPDTVQLGDVTKWQSWDIDWAGIDLVMGGFPCFAAGTLVTTSTGLKPIETIKKGDKVITHKNRFKKVVIPMVKISDHINIVKIQGSHELKVTDEHPFYVRKRSRRWNKDSRWNERVFSQPEWVAANDLDKDCFIGVPVNQNKIVPEFNGDTDFWYMIGRYVADGYSSTLSKHSRGVDSAKVDRCVYKTIITCGKHEEGVMDAVISRVSYRATKSIDRTSIKYTISNKELWTFIQAFGRGAENKEIPSFVFDMPIELIKSFVDGYLSGDGCLIDSDRYKGNKNMIQLTTVSEKLAYGIIQLVQKAFKTQPSISKANVSSTKMIEGRLVNQKPFYTVRFHKTKVKSAKYFEEDGFIWTPFKSIDRFEEETLVYNFEVECDNSYSVNNLIVHNCQSWSLAGKGKGDQDDRGALFWTMLDIMKKVLLYNPKAKFLMENVKMKTEFEQYITSHTEAALGKVHKLLINSSLVSAQNRQRYYWANWEFGQPEDKGIVLADILESEGVGVIKSHGELKKRNEKSQCVDANYHKGADNHGQRTMIRPAAIVGRKLDENGKRNDTLDQKPVQCLEVQPHGKSRCLSTVAKDTVVSHLEPGRYPNGTAYRKLTPTECERLQTVDDNYTAHVSNTQRYRMLGNGFTVEVIRHILSCNEWTK